MVGSYVVSIPQSGFGAFELELPIQRCWRQDLVSIPQSGFGAFELPGFAEAAEAALQVSIPQSGFGAFERLGRYLYDIPRVWGFNPSVGIRGV